MITTSDEAMAERLRLLRNHGDTGKYNHISLGYNYRMTNLQGAIGQIQLRKLDEFNSRRIRNAEFLDGHLKRTGISAPYKEKGVKHVYNQYVVRIEDELPASRQRVMEWLQSKGIGSAVHYPKPVYDQPLYRELGFGNEICPVSEEVSSRVLSLPVHPSLR